MESKNEIKKFFYNKKDYEFRLSKGAKVELEEQQNKQIAKLQETSPEAVSLLLNGLNEENLNKMSDEEKAAMMIKITPYITLLNELNDGLDVYETAFILLKNNLKYKDEMTREYFDEMVFNMEETIGFVETYAFLEEIRDNVFTILQGLQKQKTQETKRKESVKKKLN